LKLLAPFWLGSIALLACSLIASADPADLIPLGYLSYDVTVPGASAVFDITNQTGPNSTPFPDPTWPVVTPVSFHISGLTVDFNDGSSTVFGPSYFTLAPDGLSLNGSSIDISGGNPQPTQAVLAGTINKSQITLNDGSIWAVVPPFALANSTGTGNPQLVHPAGGCISGPPTGCLQDGDFAVVYVAANPVPEPVTWEPAIWMLLLAGTLAFRVIRKVQ
jgi:hypothetical protein